MTQTEPRTQPLEQTAPHRPMMRHIDLVPIAVDSAAPDDARDWVAEGPRPSFLRRYWMFLVLFVLPVAVAVVYYGVIAADVYVSEAKFIVRSSSGNGGGGLASLVATQGMGRAGDEAHAVNEYILSRDAMKRLRDENQLDAILARPEGDVIGRFPNFYSRANNEQFFRAYRRIVDVDVDGSTGISTIEVRAFRPADAQAIAAALIARGEDFVNGLNLRSNQDAISFAERLTQEAQARMVDVERRITAYRNKEMLVNPERETSDSMGTLSNLTTEISKLEAALATQMAVAPMGPSMASMRARIKSLQSEVLKRQSEIVGGPGSIVSKLQGYDMLMLERDLATRGLAAAVTELEKARQEANSQRIYLQTIVEPGKPDQPMLPHRLPGILLVALIALPCYWIVRSFVDTTLDHQA